MTEQDFVFCTNCGTKNNTTDKFCKQCGHPLVSVNDDDN